MSTATFDDSWNQAEQSVFLALLTATKSVEGKNAFRGYLPNMVNVWGLNTGGTGGNEQTLWTPEVVSIHLAATIKGIFASREAALTFTMQCIRSMYACAGHDNVQAFRVRQGGFPEPVDRQCRNPARLSRLPGIPRGDSKQYLLSGPCGAPSWAAWEAEIKADTDPLPRVRSIADYLTPKPGDASELLKHRFLCRGGALLFVGPTGVGKSSCVLQAAFRWCLGQDFFGIEANGELKVLVIQAENDDGDIAEVRDGVFRGLISAGYLLPDDPQRIAQRVFVVCEDSKTSKEFGTELDRLLDQVRPDLVIVDPALAYLGGDALKQADVTAFCRNVLNPIIHRHNVGLILVHHTNKPPRGDDAKDGWKAGDLAYLGQGAADWANWARAVMAIISKGSHSHFELCLGKRGGRVGWGEQKDDGEWQKIYSKPIAHAKDPGVICWRDPDEKEVFDQAAGKLTGRPKKDWNTARASAVKIAGECVRTRSQLKAECLKRIPEIGSENQYEDNVSSAITAAVDDGDLEEANTHDGTRRVLLIGPTREAVGKRVDEIVKAREAKKQRSLEV